MTGLDCYRVSISTSDGARLSLIVAAASADQAMEKAETLGRDLFRRSRPPWALTDRSWPTRSEPVRVELTIGVPAFLHRSRGHLP